MAIEMIDQRIWAKPKTEDHKSHPVVCHCIDVAMVLCALWDKWLSAEKKKMLLGAFCIDEKSFKRWLMFLGAFHDIGKCTPAFIVKSRELMPGLHEELLRDGYSFKGVDSTKHFHNSLGAQIFIKLAKPLFDKVDVLNAFAVIISGHHGVYNIPDFSSINLGRGRWEEQQKELFEFFKKFFGVGQYNAPRHPPKDSETVYFIISELITVADWIASNETLFKFADQVDLKTYMFQSLRTARRVVQLLGFKVFSAKRQPFNYKLFFSEEPNEMQKVCANLVHQVKEPSLTIIEYPTGMGKSEAAFCLMHGIIIALNHEGFYYAMPTRATSNSMYKRVCILSKLLSDNPDQQLSHGYAKQNEFYRRHILKIGEIKVDDVDAVFANEWFTKAKCKLVSPLGVGTVDQVELSTLKTRHMFMRLAGLANKVVVFDEVHAYDTYMTTVLKEFLALCFKLRISVIMLSATLTKAKTQELAEAYRGYPIVAFNPAPYPRITHVTRDSVKSLKLKKPEHKKIKISVVEDDFAKIIDGLIEKIRYGGILAIIVNTVRRCLEFSKFLKGQGIDVITVHARFPVDWKEEIEEEVVRRAGKDGQRERCKPLIIIATQVIEQSLDVDFDYLISDLCPLDLLIQRIGRLWRHKLSNRPFAEPECRIIMNAPMVGNMPDFKKVYPYPEFLMLKAYLKIVYGELKEIVLPDDGEDLVEFNYTNDRVALNDQWNKVLKSAYASFCNASRRDTRKAECNTIPAGFCERICGHLNSLEINADEVCGDCDDSDYYSDDAHTRRLRENVTLLFLRKKDNKFLLLDEDTVVDHNGKLSDELLKKLNGSAITIQYPIELVKFLKSQELPIAWRKNPLLYNCKLVYLDDKLECRVRCPKLYRFRLSKKLGLEIL